ncbi:MAG: Stage II sporulation protein P [Sporanaerobacter sp.]|jgi:stage II sporulation protein P|uniref:stage II sporulation protein P n=1 Tax=Sporanaerobacter sp. TaxID=2010183 RepID=UPI003A102DFE
MNTKVYRTRFYYVLFALFCVFIFFLGSTVVMKYFKDDLNPISDYEESVEVFSFEKPERIDKSEILLKIISVSNSSMSAFLKGEREIDTGLYELIRKNLSDALNIDIYIKAQFPALFTLIDAKNSIQIPKGKDIEVSKDDNLDVQQLEDLIFVEDLMESEEGEFLKENEIKSENINLEGIPVAQNIKKLEVNKEKPYVLIYHTHGTEAYLPVVENTCHTIEKKYNVLTIGDIISESLENAGHGVLHVTTYHDSPSYNGSYTRSLNTIKNVMGNDSNLKVVFDIHRDGIPENASYKSKAVKQSKIVIDEKDVATFSIVIGPDSPNVDEVLKFAKYIKVVSDTLYPGLCKGIIIKPSGKFNQFVSDYYALIEIGSNFNTIEEAQESAKLVGKILSVVIDKLQE